MTAHHSHYHCCTRFLHFSLAIVIIIVIDIIFFVQTIRTVNSDQESIVVNRFPKRIDPTNTFKFNHLALNISQAKAVFIGANNWLFQLDLDLNPLHNISLKEYFNSDCHTRKRPNCSSLLGTLSGTDQNSDYVTKALVIDWTNNWLIACGTWQHGGCLISDLHNISNVLFQPQEMVVADDLFSSAVAFIAPGPSSSSSPKTRMVLYVASNFTIERSEIVASRSLEPETLMSFAYSDVSSGTRLNIKSDIGPDFYLRYVYGFQSEGYSFFLLVRSAKLNYPQRLITKLVRICQNDNRYYSYTEVPITCNTSVEFDSSQAYAAYFLKAPNVSSSSSSSQQKKSSENQEYLFVIFRSSTNPFQEQNRSNVSSTLCIYQMRQVHEKFNQNIGKCFAGQGFQNIAYVHAYSTLCQPTNMSLKDYACGSDVNQQLDTEDPIVGGQILITESPINMTSVLAHRINNRMIFFVGNSHGQLSKYRISSGLSYPFWPLVKPFGHYNLTVKPEPILSEMAIVNDHIYLMFSDKVLKVKIQQCDRFKTCTECISSDDPYCGWCLSENRCSLIDQCQERSDWIHEHEPDKIQCTRIADIRPSSIAISTRKSIKIIVKNLRFPIHSRKKGLHLWCEFHFVGNFSNTSPILVLVEPIDRSNRPKTKIICPSPDERLLPEIPSNNHFLSSRLVLSFRPSSNSVDFQSGSIPIDEIPFDFYDCSSYSNCTDCVETHFDCVWCLLEHVCKHSEAVCSMDKRLAPNNRQDLTASKYCPQIAPIDQKTKFLVHEKLLVNVSVFLLNYPMMPDYKIECRFNISSMSGYVSTVGRYNDRNQTIQCQPVPLVSSLHVPHADNFSKIIIPLEILVDGYLLDNPYNIHLVMYRCWNMAQTCDECLSLNPEYGCGWCARDGLFGVQISSCHEYSHCVTSQHFDWIDQTSELACPDPKIIEFNPKCGPLQGGTMLTVKGENLGRSLADLNVTIYVSKNLSIHCQPQELQKGKILKCLLDYNPFTGVAKHNQGGPIVIRIKNQHQAQSHQWYCFLQPKLISFHPAHGPKSGGTILHVEANFVYCGASKLVKFGAETCPLRNMTLSSFEIITPRVEWDQKLSIFEEEWKMIINITVVIDQTELYFPSVFYIYEDPEIDTLKLYGNTNDNQHPTLKNDYIAGIPSGGIYFMVFGRRLNVVQKPKFYVEVEDDVGDGLQSLLTARHELMQPNMFQSDCKAVNKSLMICETPKVPEDALLKLFTRFNINSNYTLLNFGFIMDDCQNLRSLTLTSTKFPLFRMYKQPKFHQFKTKDLIKHVMDQEFLTISGENLDSLAQFSSQITIWIGDPTYDSEIFSLNSSPNDHSQPNNICKIISYTSKQLICRLPLIGSHHPSLHDDGTPVAEEIPKPLPKPCKMKVQISIGNVRTSLQSIGFVDYCHHDHRPFLSGPILWIIIIFLTFLVSTITILVIYFKCITSEQRKKLQSEKKEREKREIAMNKEAREAFSQMQLDDRSESAAFSSNLDDIANICHPFETFALNTLLNGKQESSLLLGNEKLAKFAALIQEKQFLLLLIHTLDNKKNFPLKDRINFGSNLVMALSHQMCYLTEVMMDLLEKVIKHHQESGLKILKILLRRNERIVERVFSTWLTLLLYDHLLEADLPKSFYQLYLAIKSECYRAPVDQLVLHAKNTLSLEQLLRVQVEYKKITIIVSIFDDSETNANKIYNVHNSSEFNVSESSEDRSKEEDLQGEQHIYEKLIPKSKHDYEENQYKKSEKHQISVLSCDTIEQVIKKSLDIIYRSVPFSKRPYTWDRLELECVKPVDHLDQKVLKNRDQTNECTTKGNVNWHRLNTVGHYQIKNGEEFCLIPKEFRDTTKNISAHSIANTITSSVVSLSTCGKLTNEKLRPRTKSVASNLSLSAKIGKASANNVPLVRYVWHLTKMEQEDSYNEDDLVKLSPDIQQPRCLAFKMRIDPYVNGLFQRILSIKSQSRPNTQLVANGYAKLTLKSKDGRYEDDDDEEEENEHDTEIVCKPIKFIFDFFDQQAEAISSNPLLKGNHHNLDDDQSRQQNKEELCHIWKSNCLPLRVWANILANPEFLLDVEPDPVVKSNLMIVNQIFMESCSVQPPVLNENSPPSKLCYSKDFPKYNRWVHEYYESIRRSKSITAEKMKMFLDEFSKRHSSKIDRQAALSVLYELCQNHREFIIQTLANSNNPKLCARFQLLVPEHKAKC